MATLCCHDSCQDWEFRFVGVVVVVTSVSFCFFASMAADRKQTKEILTILSLCCLWYIVSSSNNVIGKTVLNDFPYPMTMTMVQLLTITIFNQILFNIWNIRKYHNEIQWKYYFKLIIPLALGKFIASVSSHVSIWKVPVSYAHTVKATMPLFTVILSRVIMKEKQTLKVYLSLIPIITGVSIATATEISFDVIGLISALIATMGFSLMNIFSKKVLHDTQMHHLRLLFILSRLALVLFLPIWMFNDMFNLLKNYNISINNDDRDYNYRILGLLFLDGILNWLQNIIAFSVLSLVTPLTYAVANCSKRIFIISISLFILGNPVTNLNIFGMLLAIFGVLFYNKAKYDAKQIEKKQTLLPFNNKQSNHIINNIINDNKQYLNGYNQTVTNGTIINSKPTNNLLFV